MHSEASLPTQQQNVCMFVCGDNHAQISAFKPLPTGVNQSKQTGFKLHSHCYYKEIQMKEKYGERWQKLLGTHIHFTIYKKLCYVSSEGKSFKCCLDPRSTRGFSSCV